jgi:hypothetical protein
MRNRLVQIGNVLVILAAVLLGCPPGVAQEEKKSIPRLVMLVRHAEKPPDEKLSVDLSAAGGKRARALPGLFTKSTSRPHPLPTPNFIFAAQDSKHSHRCTETVAPLAKKVGLKVNAAFANDDFAKLAAEILGDPKYAGKTILICWHHGNLPGLARKLGGTGAPDHWKGGVFDRVWRVTYASSGKATVDDLPQRLLPSDSKK